MDLNFNETFVINVLREFDFLRRIGYSVIFLNVYGRDPALVFENISAKRKISVSWEGDLIVIIERSRQLNLSKKNSEIVLNNYLNNSNKNITIGSPEKKISRSAEFLKKELLQVVEGRGWVED